MQSNGSQAAGWAAGCRSGISGCPTGLAVMMHFGPPLGSQEAAIHRRLWAGSLENPAEQVRGFPW